MIKKIISLLSVLAFASFSSFALAGLECGDRKGCDGDKSEASAPSHTILEASCGCSGGKDKDGDKS